ncbi:MAG TPA: hypothetical protein VGB44_02865 [Flavobacterium sp.]|jgi:hypothetical protein
MEDREFLLSAESLANNHPDDSLAVAYLEAFYQEPQDLVKCKNLASQVILKLLDVKPEQNEKPSIL